MKKNLIIVLGLLISFLLCSICVYAWYVSAHKVGHIDGESDGIVLEYKFNDDSSIIDEYNVSNIAFFDVDNPNETKYFKLMATKVEIKLVNKGKDDITVSLNSTNTPKEIKDSEDNVISRAYVKLIFSSEEISDYSNNADATILTEYITNREALTNVILPSGATTTVCAYVFGIQEKASAQNDFLNETYEFSIVINAK